MKENGKLIRDSLLTLGIIGAAFGLNMLIHRLFDTKAVVPMIFVLGVFLVSLKTSGYFWGILASVASVLIDVYAFTDPYYAFALYWSESLITTAVMLLVAIMTNMLTVKLKKHERRYAEAEKEKMRANLLRAISHDLRTPLTSIYGSSSTLLANFDSLKREKHIKLLREINEDSEWLIRMVENLLSVTRINGEGVRINTSLVVLEELVDVALSRFQARHPQQSVEVAIPGDIVAISADPLLIEQVIMNILENAVFHAKGMKSLSFTVTEREKDVLFEIRDDGCGMPENVLSEIFTGYVNVTDRPADGSRDNMGIGLSICAAIIHAHGGNICAENAHGGGAVFRFTLKKESIEHEQQ